MNIRDKELLIRSKSILTDNIYEKDGYPWSPYRCITPGKTEFDGIWNWDSAFHAVGVSRWDTELAKESILGFLKFQREDGLLPDVIWESGEFENRYTKPPVFAWATKEIYQRDNDIDFLNNVYPALKKNAEFYMRERSCNGLFFYDSDDKDSNDYITHVKWESGWDNSVRWDNKITEYYAIDLNCFMVMTFRSLQFIATELGLSSDIEFWHNEGINLSLLINERMWSTENGYYADACKSTGAISEVLTPASFMPLFIEIATTEQAKAMKKIAEEKFDCKMPTVSFDNPEYSNDYWRGPTWLNVAYFAAKGLKNYNFDVADKIKENILNMCYNEHNGIFENYDSITGRGLCCDHFSWSCVFIAEFILNW